MCTFDKSPFAHFSFRGTPNKDLRMKIISEHKIQRRAILFNYSIIIILFNYFVILLFYSTMGNQNSMPPEGLRLREACQRGCLKDVRKMVEAEGVDVNVNINCNGSTPLHLVAESGNLPVVQYLCEQGADKEVMSNDGWTPLHRAAADGHLSVVQYLCEQGADQKARDLFGFTPMDVAAQFNQPPVVQYLRAKAKATPRDAQLCGSCGKACSLQCALCYSAFYCDAACQKVHWKVHKRTCPGYEKKR